MQKILTMSATGSQPGLLGLRSPIDGWTLESAKTAKQDIEKRLRLYDYDLRRIPVGLLGDGSTGASHCYPTVLHAMADGWRLMAPPLVLPGDDDDEPGETTVEWWLEKTEIYTGG